MVGLVVVTHNQLGNAFIDTAEAILGSRPEALVSVSVTSGEDAGKLRRKIARGIRSADQRRGVIILTDMFGGTPSNLSYSFLKEGRVDVISAVNLPILLKAVSSRKQMNLATLSKCLETYGKKNISLASEILKGNRQALCPFDRECVLTE